MDQQVYKSLLSDVKSGELKKFVNELPSSQQLTQEAALNFVICCCNACTYAKDNFSAEDLITTLRVCSKAIRILDDTLSNSYLRSLYYILKFFLAQENPKYIIQLEFLLLPEFKQSLNDKSNKTLYQECCKITHNFISKIFYSEPKAIAEDFLNLCVIYFKMCFEVSPNDLMQQKLYNFFGYCQAYGVDTLELNKVFLFILNLLEERNNRVVWNEELCNSIFSLLGFLVKPLVKRKYFSDVKDVIHYTVNCIRSNFSCFTTDKAISIIDSMAALITEEKYHPSKKHVSEALTSSANQIDQLIKSQGVSAITCRLWHTIVNCIVNNYKSFSPTFWKNTISDTVQIELFKLTKSISIGYSQVKLKCPCGKCGFETDFASAYSCCVTGGYLFQESCDKIRESNASEKLTHEFQTHMIDCCKFISKLKQRGCANWKVLWKEIGAILYNVSIHVQKLSTSQRIEIKKLFVKYLIEFEGDGDSIILKDILKLSLSCLTNDYLERKEPYKALAISALNMYLRPNERKSLFLKWAHVKSEYKDNMLLQELNLATVLVKYEPFIKSIHPNFMISKANKIELLKFELDQYKAVWPSKISINCVLRELYELADIVMVVKALVQIWDVSSIHKYIYDVLELVLASYEKEANTAVEDKINLACLYYIRYNAVKENMRSENMKDIKTASNIMSRKESDDEHVIFSNDECDVVTSYESLNLNRYDEAMKFLHRALNTFEKCMDFNAVKILKEEKVYNILMSIAFEYRLQCYTLEYFRACFLCLKIARMTLNKLQIIKSIGCIIEKGNVESNSMRTLIFEADQLIISLAGDDTTEKWETLTLFYISKSTAYLLNGDTSLSVTLYDDAKSAYHNYSCKSTKNRRLLDIRMDYLQWLLYLLSCEYKIEGHFEDSLAKPVLILHAAQEHYRAEGHNSPYFMVILFEAYAALVHKYVWLRLPRETRCYCKEVTLLTQKLLIPLQSVKFLSHLAQADLMSDRFDDCLVKFHGICEILCISKRSCVNLTYAKVEDVEKSVELLSNRMQEVMLNIPSSFHEQRAARCGSPVCETAQLTLPSFTGHHGDCNCYHCMSIDFQEFVLIILNLSGQLNAYQSNFSTSREHYNNALNIYDHLMKNKSKFREKIFHLIEHDVFPNIEIVLIETYTSILLNIGYNTIGTSEYDEINQKIFPVLQKIKPINIQIYNEACLQNTMNNMYHRQLSKRSKVISLSPMMCEQPENASSFLTPDSKCSIVKVPVTTSPQPSPRKLPVIKRIKFVLSDEEGSNENKPKSTLKVMKKTPAPPPPSDLTNVRKAPSVKTKLNMNCSPTPSTSADENKPPQKSLARASQNKNAIKRTKLLTEKLKKEAVGKVPLKQVPSIRVTVGNDDDKSEQDGKQKTDVQDQTESEKKQEPEQEPRRSKRIRSKHEHVKDTEASNKGDTKRALRH